MPPPPVPRPPGATARALAHLDALADRVYGSRYNPLYRSGALTVALLALLIITGLYLLLFYRVGSPYASVARITEQVWLGRWIRGVHRFAADAAVITAGVHAMRMFAQRRSWGRRTMPWVSGIGLLALIFVCGWTGYVMIWDTFGHLLAVEGARVIDLVPLFSEPVGRAFVGERAIPGAFFFLNLFLHIALPIGMGIALLLHVSRVARPVLFPAPRALWWGAVLLVAVAVAFPVEMAPQADPLRLPRSVPIDPFYGFWLPAARAIPATWTATGAAVILAALLLVPRLTRPAPEHRLPASEVNERLCTGCEQCTLDCPYQAITMVPRADGRATLVAQVDASRCVSCGICAGSCAPMGVGPPRRTGRDQLARARAFVERHVPNGRDIIIIACTRGAGGLATRVVNERVDGALLYPLDCAGSLHTSVVELFVRAGAGGVLVLACPPENCWNREGTIWLEQRLFHEREAELKERVDRRRVAFASRSFGDARGTAVLVAEFRARMQALEAAHAEERIDLVELCDAVLAPLDASGDQGP
jgi:ferredoxin